MHITRNTCSTRQTDCTKVTTVDPLLTFLRVLRVPLRLFEYAVIHSRVGESDLDLPLLRQENDCLVNALSFCDKELCVCVHPVFTS